MKKIARAWCCLWLFHNDFPDLSQIWYINLKFSQSISVTVRPSESRAVLTIPAAAVKIVTLLEIQPPLKIDQLVNLREDFFPYFIGLTPYNIIYPFTYVADTSHHHLEKSCLLHAIILLLGNHEGWWWWVVSCNNNKAKTIKIANVLSWIIIIISIIIINKGVRNDDDDKAVVVQTHHQQWQK